MLCESSHQNGRVAFIWRHTNVGGYKELIYNDELGSKYRTITVHRNATHCEMIFTSLRLTSAGTYECETIVNGSNSRTVSAAHVVILGESQI